MSGPSKVDFLITGLAYGGAETQLVRLATRLKARGWDVRVVSMTPPKAYVEDLEEAKIPLHSLDIRRKLPDPRPIFCLVRLIRIRRPDILHSHMFHANFLARLVRLLAPAPVLICTAHNIHEGGRLRELLYRLTDPLCDLTTQVSEAGLERYVRVKAVPRHKIRFIPNGVDAESRSFDPEIGSRIRDEMGLQNAFVWLAVGRLYPQKDYPNMLQAFSIVSRVSSEAFLLIVGEGPLRRSLEEHLKDLGIEDRVKFLGTGQDVPGLMNAADGYLMSSAWEGMPIVLLEAGASALPIVATEVGGNGEVVRDGETGFLVPPKNPELLANAMLKLMDLPLEERSLVGEAGRNYIEANYHIEEVVGVWEALYVDLFERKGIK